MRLLLALLLTSCAAFAQLTDGVATTVSRTVTLTPDQADFAISAGASLGTTQQQATQVLLDAGLSNLTLTGTSLGQAYDYSTSPYTVQTLIFYQFAFSIPASGLKDTANTMEKIRTQPPDAFRIFQYSAGLSASPATVEAMHQTLLPQLFADAQKKAQAIATAAGLKLGAIRGVSEYYYSGGSSGSSWLSSGNVNTTVTTSSTSSSGGTQFTFYASVTYGVAQ
jgi:uncharacterized protein YggE